MVELITHEDVVILKNSMEHCNIVLEFRQMVKVALISVFLLVYFLHHLKSDGRHVLNSKEMHICEDTPIKHLCNVGIHTWQSQSCKLQLTTLRGFHMGREYIYILMGKCTYHQEYK
jgi:hypothetical protein